MPNFYTHLKFAREVFWGLSPDLQKRLSREWGAYLSGNFGPDPLYFANNALRQVGLSIHHGSGRKAMEPFRQALERRTPWSESFVSGYYLHFLLDSAMHPVVYAAMEETGCSHRRVEGELDRMLMEKDKISHREAFPSLKYVRAYSPMAAQMAPGVTPEDYRRGLVQFRAASLKLCDWTGTPMGPILSGASLLPGIHGLRGAVLAGKPDRRLKKTLPELERVFSETVERAPALLEEFLDCAHSGKPFPAALDCDYSGNEVR